MQIIAGIILVLAILAGIEIYRTDYTIVSEKLNIPEEEEKKIVFLSDLHNQQYGQNNEKLVKAIRESAPDLIWIGGDMLIGKEDTDYAPALSFVKEITGICPVYYANGNHEQRMKESPDDYQYSYAECIFWKMKRYIFQIGMSHFGDWRFRCPVTGVSGKEHLQ